MAWMTFVLFLLSELFTLLSYFILKCLISLCFKSSQSKDDGSNQVQDLSNEKIVDSKTDDIPVSINQV